jgi:LuxR family maltose regulon positive regulatory protein
VAGGRGEGKSLAVAAWSRSIESDGWWIDGASVDRDPAEFWSRLAALLSAPSTVDTVDGVSISPRLAVMRYLASLEDSRVLVVDDVHELDAAVVDDLIGLADVAPRVRLVLVTRDLRTIADRLDDRAPLIVTGERLAFTLEEAELMLATRGVTASAGVVAFLHASSAGIPLLLATIARALSGQSVPGDWLSPVQVNLGVNAVERIVGAGEAPGLSGETLSLVRAAALLVDATAAEVATVAEASEVDARDALDAAVHQGWGGWDTDRDLFSFAPIVARALTFRLVLKRSRSVLVRAAHTLSARGEGMRALLLAFAAQDDGLVLRMASRHAASLVVHHRQILVLLEHISRQRAADNPLIAMAIAICHSQDPKSRIPMLMNYARAERLARTGTSSAHASDRVLLHLVRAVALWGLGRYVWARRAADAAVRLLDELPESDTALLLVSPGVVYGQAALAALAVGDVLDARQLAERAIGVAKSSGMIRHHSLTIAALLAAIDGDVVAARGHLDAAALRPAPNQFHLRAVERLAEAVIAVETGHSEAARAIIDDIGPRIRTIPLWTIAEVVLAIADALEGRTAASARRLRAASSSSGSPPPSRTDKNTIGALLALVFLAQGDASGARSAGASLGATGAGLVVRAARDLASHDAVATVMDATSGLSVSRTIRVRTSLLLLRGAAALRLDRMTAARRDATVAADLMIEHGQRTPWLVLAEDDRRGIVRLLEDDDDRHVALLKELESMPTLVSDGERIPQLTGRERLVLEGVFARETNGDIAARLGVSPNTVKKQRASLYRKLGVSSWEGAVKATLDLGLLDNVG